MKIRYALILLLPLIYSHAPAADLSVEYYCIPADVEHGDCRKGDLTVVLSADDALMVCDFGKDVIAISTADHFICYYRGSERVRRSRLKSDEHPDP